MLHLISQSPIEKAILERIDKGDDVVFLENAILHILAKGLLSYTLTQLLKESKLFVLEGDIVVRGIAATELVTGIEVIDYSKLVDLTVKNKLIQSW
ncbi:MAG: sulfurtransferase complex subunit TusB [Methylococcales bacterium]|jgi:tRNA 2-thiouridine synthesizing protein B|nr:sulfurtransferase complex subunit TusB [Methylococcales bacterium]